MLKKANKEKVTVKAKLNLQSRNTTHHRRHHLQRHCSFHLRFSTKIRSCSNTNIPNARGNSADQLCCQVLAELSGQSDGIYRPLGKKFQFPWSIIFKEFLPKIQFYLQIRRKLWPEICTAAPNFSLVFLICGRNFCKLATLQMFGARIAWRRNISICLYLSGTRHERA